MDEITPEIVARLATKIYQESVGGGNSPEPIVSGDPIDAFPTGPSSAHGARGIASMERAAGPMAETRPLSSVSGISLASRGGVAPTVDDMQRPLSPGGQALPSVHPRMNELSYHPARFSGSEYGRSEFAAAQSTGRVEEAAGLKGFVQQVRMASYRGSSPEEASLLKGLRKHLASSPMPFESPAQRLDPHAVRADFPILHQQVNGYPLAWLDNAATTQKPRAVIEAVARFYERDNSNIHRGAHALAARATDAYEHARETVARFLGAGTSQEIVFVRGATEGINLVARTFSAEHLRPGDEILLTVLEHHANIVPWQMIAKERGAILRVIPVDDAGDVVLSEYQRLLGPRTKLVGLAHANNSLGTILPIAEMTAMAKRFQARVLVDGAQSVAHVPVHVKQLGVDFYVFSGHKIFGPTGIGAVYVTEELHDLLPPWQGGGNMIQDVTFEATTYAEAPARFEAGTPNIADAVGLAAALEYVQRLGLASIARYEHELLGYATQQLLRVPGLRLIGQAREKVGVLSFVLPHLTPLQVGQRLNEVGIAVRAGHHCAQPSLRRFGLDATVRPSLSFYNTKEEIDRLADTLHRLARGR